MMVSIEPKVSRTIVPADTTTTDLFPNGMAQAMVAWLAINLGAVCAWGLPHKSP